MAVEQRAQPIPQPVLLVQQLQDRRMYALLELQQLLVLLVIQDLLAHQLSVVRVLLQQQRQRVSMRRVTWLALGQEACSQTLCNIVRKTTTCEGCREQTDRCLQREDTWP